MLISHRHRFVFIKTRKTAGTSIEISLSRYCDGPDDVITPLSPVDNRFRRGLGVRPKNFRREEGGGKRFRNHSRAARVRSELGEAIWSEYTTFCFTRNPWDRVVSQYWFRQARRRKRRPVSFEDFVRQEMFTRELPLYSQHGAVIVDHVAHFEDLSRDLKRITSAIGLDWDGWLPHAKGGFRPPRVHYSELYTPELAAIVDRRCHQEIELHGYRFEPGEAPSPATPLTHEAAAIPPSIAKDLDQSEVGHAG